jgi:hypothetical protein
MRQKPPNTSEADELHSIGLSGLLGSRPKIPLDEVDTRPEFIDDSLHDIIPDDSSTSAPDALERKEIISLLVERITQLPEMQKVLAMYYYENMQLSEIAALFGVDRVPDLPNSQRGGRRAPQILNQAVGMSLLWKTAASGAAHDQP